MRDSLNNLKLNNRIQKVVSEVQNIMIELETGSGSDNVKHNKGYKYTLDEALQAVLKFNDESDYSDLSVRAHSEVSIQSL